MDYEWYKYETITNNKLMITITIIIIITNRMLAYGCLMRRHCRRWCQIVHVRVVSTVILVVMCRCVMMMWMMMMRLVMVMMRWVTISACTAVCWVTTAGTHGRRSVIVVMQVHQAWWWLRDSRTPYGSWCIATTTYVN